MTLFCFVILRSDIALQELSTGPKSDSETVTAAIGSRELLEDIRVIMCMEIWKMFTDVYYGFPTSAGVTIDLAVAATVLQNCAKEFKCLRQNVDSEWHRMCTESTMFALKHGIKADFPDERRRQKKKMCGE